MSTPPSDPEPSLDELIERLRAGDDSARDALITRSCAHMVRCARRMLRDFPGVRRWEETDDVYTEAARRLWQALGETFLPESPAAFYFLAARQIRRVLLDLARRYAAANRHEARPPGPQGTSSAEGPGPEPLDTTHEPGRLARWTELHEQAESLPEPERDVTDLLFYTGLTQQQAAEVLGVSVRTVRNRWLAARGLLAERLGGPPWE